MEQYAPTLTVKVARAEGVEQQSPCAEVARGATKERPPLPMKDVEGDDIASVRAPRCARQSQCKEHRQDSAGREEARPAKEIVCTRGGSSSLVDVWVRSWAAAL